MRKFLAVIKREYLQRVRTKFFVIMTILAPALMAGFTVVPALMFSIKAGGPTRLAIVDQTGKMYQRVSSSILGEEDLSADDSQEGQDQVRQINANPKQRADEAGKLIHGSFELQEVRLNGRTLAEVEATLNARVQNRELDGYLILPPDLVKSGQPEFYARNTADPFTKGHIRNSITDAVRSARLEEAKIDEAEVRRASAPVSLKTTGAGGEESKGEANFYLVFGMGLMIYMSVLLYGQVVLGAVIEEKETRIAEILFSSMRSFPLMIGKLVGVSLVALTQLGIWGLAFAAFTAVGIPILKSRGIPITLHLPPIIFVYFVIFFLLGFFIYSSIYAVVGSMVTTTQEGGQMAFPVVMMLIIGFYLSFSIIRSPSSTLAFWASMFPFFAPITMLVRIVTETPPFWQIALSLGIGTATIVGLVWLASRIYRVGMLMTGKKASIPEVWRWVRQA